MNLSLNKNLVGLAKEVFKNSYRNPTLVPWVKSLRHRYNWDKGIRQNSPVTSVERVLDVVHLA